MIGMSLETSPQVWNTRSNPRVKVAKHVRNLSFFFSNLIPCSEMNLINIYLVLPSSINLLRNKCIWFGTWSTWIWLNVFHVCLNYFHTTPISPSSPWKNISSHSRHRNWRQSQIRVFTLAENVTEEFSCWVWPREMSENQQHFEQVVSVFLTWEGWFGEITVEEKSGD